MKKVGIIACFIVLLTGCNQSKQSVYENTMEKYAKRYYEENMKNVVGQNGYEISIKALKKYNDVYGEEYDLSSLEKCKDSSYTTVILNSSKTIKKYEHHLDCK